MITAAPQNDLSLNYYRALFDYDPTTMSPNPNHHDEIKFKEMLLPGIHGPKPVVELRQTCPVLCGLKVSILEFQVRTI